MSLEPDRDQLEIFVDALLRYAGHEGYVSLRSFLHNNEALKPLGTVRLKGTTLKFLIDVAEDQARRAANNLEPAVFCPPIAVFNGAAEWQAREKDLFKGLALSVECDEHPHEARTTLQEILGPATAIVRSGGQWVNPDSGPPEDKLHLHWRLRTPATDAALPKLKQARALATAIVGGDPSAVPTVHCLRWPGSWHRKAAPQLCELVAVNPDSEIDLETALAALEAKAPQPAQANGHDPGAMQEAAATWRELVDNIIAGRNLHFSITRLAAKYVSSGMAKGAAVNQLRALMELSAARRDRPEDWQTRYDYIPRAVETAEAKFSTGDQDEEPPQKPRGPAQDKTNSSPFQLKPFASIKVSRAPNYLVKGILPRTGLVVVWGPPKCGKSFWTFDLVMHVAINRKYRRRHVQQGSVVYLALEGGSGFAGRIAAWRKRGLAEHDQAVPFFLLDVPLDLVRDRELLIKAIRAQLGDTCPAVIVVDTLNRSLVGDENKSDDMANFIRAVDDIRLAFDCLVIVVHHCGIAKNRPRGHTSLAGADDAQIAVERDKEGHVIATVEHMKDAEAGAVIASTLERVELGADTDGDEISSCVIAEAETAAKGPKLNKAGKLGFDVLTRLLKSEGEAAPANFGLPADSKVVKQAAWREEFYKVHPADKTSAKQKAFVRVHADLYEAHLVQYLGEFAFLNPDNPDKTAF